MSDVPSYLWLIPAFPLAGAVITAFLGPHLLRRQSHWPCVLGAIGACVVSFFVLAAVLRAPAPAAAHEAVGGHEAAKVAPETHEGVKPPQVAHSYYSWISVTAYYHWIHVPGEQDQSIDIGVSLRADALTAMMLVMITFIGTFIAIYSIGYMHDDPGYARFFASVSLFLFMMTILVLADNFVMLYLGWEGVGLCSYLLIGFWFTKPAAANAARKAWLVTRLGDTGFMVGILLIWVNFGHKLDYDSVLYNPAAIAPLGHGVIVSICLLLLCGAVGKSAQFPLHVWLPDAMEGPTPVSALIHAATMVTAGVYLVARCTPLFVLAPEAQAVVACLGAFTALLAALIALTQNDLKRVLAYSTLSQLGYMFLALGCGLGSLGLATFAVIAAMFHLFTHAFFKALLFLTAGSVMHAMGHVIDMRRFSGLRRVMPYTHWTFLCGAGALAGFPGLSGFWSKDDVLAASLGAGNQSGWFSGLYYLLFASALFTAFLTAFYTFRAYFMTFWGETRVPPEADQHDHAHAETDPHHHGTTDAHRPHEPAHGHGAPTLRDSYESPPVMTIPLMVLAFFAVCVGGVLGPLGPGAFQFSHFLGLTPALPAAHEHHINWALMGASSVLALAGIGLAWLMYVRVPDMPARLARSAQGLYQLSLNKFHFDELYAAFIVAPLRGAALFCRIFDLYVIDGLVDLIGHIPGLFGVLFRPIQNGLAQFYSLAMILGVTAFLAALLGQLLPSSFVLWWWALGIFAVTALIVLLLDSQRRKEESES